MFPAGELNERATIQQKTVSGKTASGEKLYTWTDVATIWVGREETGGDEAVASERETPRRVTQFKARYRAGITTAMRLVQGARIWDIKHVQPEPSRGELILTAVEQPATAPTPAGS